MLHRQNAVRVVQRRAHDTAYGRFSDMHCLQSEIWFRG